MSCKLFPPTQAYPKQRQMNGFPQQNISSTGFLLLTAEYPSQTTRQSFLSQTASTEMSISSLLHKPLPLSTPNDDWQLFIKILLSIASDSFLNKTIIRPLRPNDDNYTAFEGEKWLPEGFGKVSPGSHPQLQAFLQRASTEPTPHYNRCARCTSLKLKEGNKAGSESRQSGRLLRCGRCKIVKYCSKVCQKAHWKRCHRESCVPAQETSLLLALQTNDAFWISPEECSGILEHLKQQTTPATATPHPTLPRKLRDTLETYFSYATSLGGCFVI